MLIGLVGDRIDKIKTETKLMEIDNRRNRHGFLRMRLDDMEEMTVNSAFFHKIVESRHFIAVIGVSDQPLAELVRQYGVIWHLIGRPSNRVKIDSVDIMVAVGGQAAVGHRLDFNGAWSETLRRVLHGQRKA